MFSSYTGAEVEVEGSKLLFLRETDVLGVIG
jgi:co-chaperonin GroES (HSP10)